MYDVLLSVTGNYTVTSINLQKNFRGKSVVICDLEFTLHFITAESLGSKFMSVGWVTHTGSLPPVLPLPVLPWGTAPPTAAGGHLPGLLLWWWWRWCWAPSVVAVVVVVGGSSRHADIHLKQNENNSTITHRLFDNS